MEPSKENYENRIDPKRNCDTPMNTLEDLELQIMELEERLRPIAQRPVDVAHLDWAGPLRAGAPPLDEAGVRSTAERLLGG